MKPDRMWELRLVRIDDRSDPRLDDYRDIRDRDLLGEAGRPGRFIGEQFLTVEKMLSIPGMTRSVLIAPNWVRRIVELAQTGGARVAEAGGEADEIGSGPSEAMSEVIPVYIASPEVLRGVAGFPIHRGVLAVGNRPDAERLTLDGLAGGLASEGPLTVLLCEDIANIDNIGALFRNAAAFGVDAVILSPGCHDPLYRKSIRVSIGHVLSMRWARSVNWHGDLDRVRDEWGLTLVGAATVARAVPLELVDPPSRVGLVVGPEYEGLSTQTLARCDHVARIPMAPGVDSLNVAAASAVCLHRLSQGGRV